MRRLCVVVVLVAVACHKEAVGDPTTGTVVSAAPVAVASVAPVRTYAIHLGRPAHVGDRAHIVVDADYTEHTVATLAGQPPTDTTKQGHVHVEGQSLVKELQADGRTALRDDLTVVELWQTHDNGAREVIAPKGSHLEILRAARKEDARVTLDGRAVSKAVREALGHATDLATKSGATDDEIFGTRAPQPIGGEWDINAALAEKDLIARDMNVVPGSVSGKTKLVAVRPVDGIDCLELDNTLRVGSITSMKELPPGSTIESANIDVHLHVLVPIDDSREAPNATMEIRVNAAVVVPSPKGPIRVVLESGDYKHATSDIPK